MPRLALNVVRTACALAILGITPAKAADFVSTYVPDAKLVGQGRLSVLVWDVYDAKLYAPQGTWIKGEPFALELNYLIDISGEKIATKSISHMRNLGISDEIKLATWHTQMREIFPDVTEGDKITGIYTENNETIFHDDKKEIGRIKDPEFGKAFFSIWLDDATSKPDLRSALLGW